MPLIACPDCGAQVSDAAPSCPKCARPIAKSEAEKAKEKASKDAKTKAVVWLILILGFAFALWPTDEPKTAPAKPQAKPEPTAGLSDAECRRDLRCFAEKHFVAATVRCEDQIERLAKNAHKWTDGWLEMKFPRYRWKNLETGVVTYIGDKIHFQSGFGAWVNHSYECDFDPATDSVVGVRASPGRLP